MNSIQWRAYALPYLTIAAATTAASAVLDLVGLPAPVLFGSLLSATGYALLSRTPLHMPEPATRLGQALIGVVIGTMVTPSALAAIGADLVAITAVTLATVVISVLAGRLLALRADVSAATGAFAMIAGGGAGVSAVAHDLGADDRVVAVVQQLRLLAVLFSMPAVVALAFHATGGLGPVAAPHAPVWPSAVFVAGAALIGLLTARFVPVATGSLLCPLAAAAVLAATGWLGPVDVPQPAQWLGYALVGAQVGLRFTRASLISIARMLPVVVLLVVAVVAVTAALGALLAWLTPVDGLTAYLATTPGGIVAVLAAATDTGSNPTYVMAVQVLRLLIVLAVTPPLASWLNRRQARRNPTRPARPSPEQPA
ncbi:AbrB family transcriptional regulator [Dactylosporangium sp. CA-152071]|uniref:AbrB family transcriptional regulator n=1 Tax=Dactylosporangium sp. CA-152071 TaxID=3239933 RepID=UPI003D8F15DC